MNSILEKIIENRKKLIEKEKTVLPFERLKASVEGRLEKNPDPSFLAGRKPGTPFLIAEIKKASPSKGIIRENFDPVMIADAYEASSHVSAVSVLTEPDFFQGSYENLEIAGRILKKPRLMKDFIIDEYQIYKGASLGATGYLLIAAVLRDEEMENLIKIGEAIGMTPLLEVHSVEEYRRALAGSASLIGINNRNLNTFVTDIKTTASILSGEGKPEGRIIISESGIRDFKDIFFLNSAGADGFLIGETFMRSDNITGEIEKVMSGTDI